jgi:quinol monooxygenase YgiN
MGQALLLAVSGKLYVDAEDRDAYVADCLPVIEQARAAGGCLDFVLSADPIEPGRINVYEQWSSAAELEAFRGSGPEQEQQAQIRSADVARHEIASSGPA